jgi:hypothetical protein
MMIKMRVTAWLVMQYHKAIYKAHRRYLQPSMVGAPGLHMKKQSMTGWTLPPWIQKSGARVSKTDLQVMQWFTNRYLTETD